MAKMPTNKNQNTVDRYLGERVKNRRLMVGMSQTGLGDAIGVAFQQIQKYESGKNRISVSRLVDIAEALDVNISYLLEKYLISSSRKNDSSPEINLNKETCRIIHAYNEIKDTHMRRRVLSLIKEVGKSANNAKDQYGEMKSSSSQMRSISK